VQLEELQQRWQQLDAKLERAVTINRDLLRQAVIQPTRRRVTRLALWPALDTAFCAVVLLLAGSFLAKHWNAPLLAGPASAMMIAAILLLNASIRQLILVSQLDWSGAVGDIQSSLSRLRMAKIRQFKWIILLSPLVGFCSLIVGLQGLLDWLPDQHSIFDKLNPWWVAANYGFGVLFIPFGHAVVRFFATRFKSREWWQRALADISGANLKKTQEELDHWASLEDASIGGKVSKSAE
jgi:hypothetical protein